MKNLMSVLVLSIFFITGCSLKTVFVGGNFDTFEGENAKRIMTIGFKGGKTPWFDPGTSFTYDTAFSVEINAQNDRIYLGGPFIDYNGLPANRIVLLNLAGENMEGIEFNGGSGFNKPVYVIARDPNFPDENDQRYIVGGEFTTYQGLPAPGVIRIMANGDIDPSFDPGTGFAYSLSSNPARVVTVAFDLIKKRTCFGGSFTSFDTVMTNNMTCIRPNGSVIPTFNPAGNGFTYVPSSGSYEGEVDQIAFDENYDKIYVGGRFNRFNATEVVNNLVKLGTNGSFEFNYQLEGHGTLRELFLLTEPNAIITGGKSYTDDNGTVSYNSLIKIDRDDGKLVPGFAVTPGSVNDYDGLAIAAIADGEVVEPGTFYFAGGFPKLNPTSGATVIYYNLQESRPLLRIDKTTGAIDGDFVFSGDLAVQSGAGAASISTLRAIKTPFF